MTDIPNPKSDPEQMTFPFVVIGEIIKASIIHHLTQGLCLLTL